VAFARSVISASPGNLRKSNRWSGPPRVIDCSAESSYDCSGGCGKLSCAGSVRKISSLCFSFEIFRKLHETT
jgi:hypothetical protein